MLAIVHKAAWGVARFRFIQGLTAWLMEMPHVIDFFLASQDCVLQQDNPYQQAYLSLCCWEGGRFSVVYRGEMPRGTDFLLASHNFLPQTNTNKYTSMPVTALLGRGKGSVSCTEVEMPRGIDFLLASQHC